MKFDIGDLVICNDDSQYSVTNSDVICEVIETDYDSDDDTEDIRVSVRRYKDTNKLYEFNDNKYWVYSEYFELYHGNLDVSSPEEIDCLFT